MTDRTVSVELLAKLSGYTAQTTAAAGATDKLADSMVRAAGAQKGLEGAQKQAAAASASAAKAAVVNASAQKAQFDAMTKVGKGFLTFGAIAGVGFGLAVKASTEFSKQMALVGTLAKASPAQLAALSDSALHVGQAYGYTATQVADAQAELVKAGISVKDILGGALQGTLTLAAAGQIDVAQATEIAASAMTQFALKGKDVPHIADLLAAGADKALGSVSDLGLGLSQVGTTAHQFGFSLDDTVAVLAEFAQQGQLGQKAGTELNQALLQLAAPTQQAQALMTKYGFSVYTAQGHFKSFADLANSLQISFGKLSDQQRNQALATIFGSRAIRAANILYQDGAQGVTDWEKRIQDSGFAVQQATGKLNSLSGDLLKLKAAFQTGLIEEGSGVQNTLRGIVQGLTDVVTWFDKLSPASQSMILELTGVGTVIGITAGAALIAIPKIVAFKEALAVLANQARTTAVALGEEAGAETVAGNGAAAGAGRGIIARGAGGLLALGGGAGLSGAADVVGSAAFLPIAAAASAAFLLQFQHKEENDRTDAAVKKLAADPKALAAAKAQLAKLQAQQRSQQSGSSAGTLAGLQQSVNTGGILPGSVNGASLAANIAKQKALVDAASAAAKKLTVDNYALDKGATAAQIALNNQARATAQGSLAMFKAGADADSLASSMIAIGSGADAASDQVKGLAKVIQTDMDNAAKAFAKDLDPIGNFTKGNLTKQFDKAITAGRKFNTELSTVAKNGLDPEVIQKLIAEGPAQAGPVLQKLVGKNSAAMIKMVNDQQSALDAIQAQTVENARLTAIAENANDDKIASDLATAMKLAKAKAKDGGTATAAQLASALHLGLPEVYNVAAEYGIGLLTGVKHGTDASTSKINSLKVELATLDRVKASPKVSLSGKEQVSADIAAIQAEINRLAGLHVINIQANAKINLAISGKGNAAAKGNGTWRGGTIGRPGYSEGGSVFGGPPGRDTVPAFLDNGEEVISKGPAATFRPLLKAINATGFASGGTVGIPDLSSIFSLLTTTNSKGKSIASTLGAQFGNAAGRTAKIDATFVRNLDIIAAKGFGYLAMQLLDSGDANAKTIAAQAVKWSTSHLRAVQSSLQKEAAAQKTLGLLPAELAISSALKTGKNPTLASIASATGLDPADLQAGLIAMQKSLAGNKNAGALLSGLNSTGVYSQSSWGSTTAAAGPSFTVVVPKAQRNPYSYGEKVAIGAQRVLATSSGNQSMPRW